MVIQRVLRYSDVSTTQRNYIHVRDEKMHDAMLQLDLAVDACTALVPQKDTPQSVNWCKQTYGPVAQMDRAAVS